MRGTRRPRKRSRSSVATSAQWTSSTTNTGQPVGLVQLPQNAAKSRSRGASARLSSRVGPPSPAAMSSSGPRGRGVNRPSQAPQYQGASRRSSSCSSRSTCRRRPHRTPGPTGPGRASPPARTRRAPRAGTPVRAAAYRDCRPPLVASPGSWHFRAAWSTRDSARRGRYRCGRDRPDVRGADPGHPRYPALVPGDRRAGVPRHRRGRPGQPAGRGRVPRGCHCVDE